MRITAGQLGGRVLKIPRQGVRPTQDKVRQALFSSLGELVVGARVLELFAGSGALGLEAWSRGASCVSWVESDRQIYAILDQNVKQLCKDDLSTVRLYKMDAFQFLEKSGESAGPFDLILADPPYDREGKHQWLENMLRVLESKTILAGKGLLIFEQGESEPILEKEGWRLVREKRYGETRLLMYQKITS